MADENTRALSQADPKKQARAQQARQAADGDLDAARGRGRVPLGAHAVPHPRLRQRGRHVARRLRGLLLQGLPGDRRGAGHGLGSASRTRSTAWPTGSRARRRSTSARPGTDIKLGVAGRTWVPCVGQPQHARRRVLHRPRRGLGERRGRVLVPGHLRRPRGVGRQVPLRGRQGRRRLRRARRGVPDRDARHRRRRAPPRRARDRHQLRHRHRHEGDPARREDRRHGPPGDRRCAIRRPAASTTPPCTGTWSATCARAASITVDGEELQRDGKFVV